MSTNSLREAAQQALEVLDCPGKAKTADEQAAITALRAALAEPVQSFEDEQRAINAEEHRRADALAEPVQEPVAWTDADADAARLAMELEALLLSCEDTAAVSRWWDSAHDALELHRQRLSMDGLANQQKTSGSPCPTCEALARAVMMDQTGKA